MSPEELEAIAHGVAKIAAFTGAAGAVLVLALLVLLRPSSDYMP